MDVKFQKADFCHKNRASVNGSIFANEQAATILTNRMKIFLSLILWCILLVICWPLALVILVLYPVIWLLLLPFRIVGLTIELVFKVVSAILLFPFRVLSRGNS